MRKKLVVVLLALLVTGPGAPAAPADAEPTLQRVLVTDDGAFALALELERRGFDVLRNRTTARHVEVIVSEEELVALRARGLAVTVLDRGRPFSEVQAEAAADGVPAGYPDLAALDAAMATAAADHPAICQVVDLTLAYGMPTTFEGRSLSAVKISDNVGSDEDEPAVLIVSNHHAREVVTPVIALHAIDQLTDGYGVDPQITAAVDGHEIWIAPVWNPDGYHHVFAVDFNWRKNRRVFPTGTGVDLNRNYPFGWDSACSGSTSPGSNTYKGPSAASEPESQTMLAWSNDRHFAKVIDYHSSGREVLWSYDCLTHPLDAFLQQEAIDLSFASGYVGDERRPSADGEHYQWQLGTRGAHAYLIETETQFQPLYTAAQAEATLVWPGILWMLERPIPIAGRVTDAVTGEPVTASIEVRELTFTNGETNGSGGPFGRYHVFVPDGTWNLDVYADGYLGQRHEVVVPVGAGTLLDVVLQPLPCTHGDVNEDGAIEVGDLLAVLAAWGTPGPGDVNGDGIVDVGDLLEILAHWGPC
jgi:hypothetical protein